MQMVKSHLQKNNPIIRLTVGGEPVDFLIDTGSSVSVLSMNTFNRLKKCFDLILKVVKPINLRAVNESSIKIYGKVRLNVNFNGEELPYNFLVSNLNVNIVGFDFMRRYDMMFIGHGDFMSFFRK